MKRTSKRETAAPVFERPTEFADQAGSVYAENVAPDHRKNFGLYLTPVEVADFMASQITSQGKILRLLDPAAGAGILVCAAVEHLVEQDNPPRQIEIVAYEVDQALADTLDASLANLKAWAEGQGTELSVQVIRKDFVLENGAALQSVGSFLPHLQAADAFDVVIANPPYFKLNKADPRSAAAAAVVSGQPALPAAAKPIKPVQQNQSASKSDLVLRALNRKSGVSLDELCKLTGWQAHSLRGFLSGTVRKKLDHELVRLTDAKGVTRYSTGKAGACARCWSS